MQNASNYAASSCNTPKETWFVKCARKIYTASEFYSHFARCAQFAGAQFAIAPKSVVGPNLTPYRNGPKDTNCLEKIKKISHLNQTK